MHMRIIARPHSFAHTKLTRLMKSPKHRLPLRNYGLPLCMFGLFPSLAQATLDPSGTFRPFVSETVSYDDNLFRRSSSLAAVTTLLSGVRQIKDDVMNQATGGGAVNYNLGRQKFNLNLRVSYNSFLNNSFLNHVATNNRGVWQWTAGNQLWGDVGYGYTRTMGGFTNTTFFGLDIISGNNGFANLNYAWHPRWKARAGINWQDFQHSASQRKLLNQQNLTGMVNLIYTTPSNNSSGLDFSVISGKFPNRELLQNVAVDNKFMQYNVNALLTWKLTEKTNFDGTVGYAIRQYPDVSSRNFSGETFNLMLSWAPTSKLIFSVSGWRKLTSWPDINTTYIVTEGFSVSPMWQVSPKLNVIARFDRQNLDFTVVDSLIPSTPRRDTVMSGQLSLVYKPLTSTEVTLGYQAGTRSTNQQFFDYTFNSVFTSVMVTF